MKKLVTADDVQKISQAAIQAARAGVRFQQASEHFERAFILEVMHQTEFNQSKAAERLGIHRNTLKRKLIEWKLATSRPRSYRIVNATAQTQETHYGEKESEQQKDVDQSDLAAGECSRRGI